MRLKAYTAANMAEAMQLIRDELGDDASILATEKDGDGVRVLAALEEPPPPPAAPSPTVNRAPPTPRPVATPVPPPPAPKAAPAAAPKYTDPMTRALAYHGVPDPIIAELTNGISDADALVERIEGMFRFANLDDRQETSPILLAGAPGAGKTLAAAKLAARSVIAGRAVRVITTDIRSAGAVEQLSMFTRPLGIDLETADGPAQLSARLTTRTAEAPLIIIDSAGINPFDAVELAGLSALIVASHAEPVLVMAAGGDCRESAELAEAFASVGCTRLLSTRLDIARRLGGLLTAAIAGRLALAEGGASPMIAHGLQPLSAQGLVRVIVADRNPVES